MRLRQWIILDIKRLFRGRGLVLATLLTPLAALLIFATVVAPLLLGGNNLRIPYAICNEDNSEPVRQFVSMMTNAESLQALAVAYPVNDAKIGYQLLETGQVGVLIHIPAGFYQTMSAGGDPVISLTAYPAHSFEQSMINLTLDGALRAVGQSQNLLQLVGETAIAAGADETAITALLDEELNNGIAQYMQRRAVLGAGGMLSPMGEYFPLEYYLAALFSLFAALAMLPALHLSASDLHGPICRRGLLASGAAAARYYCARLISGALLILLTLLLLIPAGGLIQGLDLFWGHGAGGLAYPALAAALLLISLCFSALSLLIGALINKPNLAVWCGFFIILAMAALSGALVAEGKLPLLLAEIGRWTPLKPAMSLIANVLFNLDWGRYGQDMLRLLLMLSVCVIAGLGLVYQRGGAR